MPIFFGQKSSLYGCNHLTADFRHAPALVICQPTGHEYERCHRAMRQLAVQAARKGVSALRFDYYATGDSAGDSEELSLSRMRLDIEQAVQYWREKTGAASIILVGIRLGATLAAQLASNCLEIDSLVLYAPVLDGETLLADWQRDRQAFVGRHSNLPRKIDAGDMLGFPVTDELVKELKQQFIPAEPGPSLKRVLILVGESEVESKLLKQWINGFSRRGTSVSVESVEDIAIWRREPMEAIVPIKAIRRILGWIAEDSHG